MIRLLICDDHAVVRAGLAQMIECADRFAPCAQAGDGHEALRVLRSEKVSVLLLDIALPGRDGLEVLQLVRREWPRLPVLMLSTYPESQYALRCLRLGANGYINKSADPEQILAAIRKVAEGGSYISPAVAESMALSLRRDTHAAPHELLSPREYQVFTQIAHGRTLAQIAEALHLSPNTVSTYRARIMDKIGTSNDVEIALYAVRHHLISDAPPQQSQSLPSRVLALHPVLSAAA